MTIEDFGKLVAAFAFRCPSFGHCIVCHARRNVSVIPLNGHPRPHQRRRHPVDEILSAHMPQRELHALRHYLKSNRRSIENSQISKPEHENDCLPYPGRDTFHLSLAGLIEHLPKAIRVEVPSGHPVNHQFANGVAS